jgi:hypothetical protein
MSFSKEFARIFRSIQYIFYLEQFLSMPTPIQSPSANIHPFLDVGIPAKYWKSGVVPNGKILITGNPSVDMEHLMLMAYHPNPGSVVYS